MKIFRFLDSKSIAKTSNCFIFGHPHSKIKPMFPAILGIFLIQDKVVLLIDSHGSQNVVNQKSQGYIHGRVFLKIFLKTNIVVRKIIHLQFVFIELFSSHRLPPDKVGWREYHLPLLIDNLHRF